MYPSFSLEERNMTMKKTLELKNPVLIDGKQVSKLTYDVSEIDCMMFSKASSYADAIAFEANREGKPSAVIMEQNTNFHLYLGMMAIVAVNPSYAIADLERIKGFDLVNLTAIGRNFIAGNVEEISSQNISDEPSEDIPESTTQESKK